MSNSANTLVTFRGFGILTFDEENDLANISIIRGEGHKLSVRIEEPVSGQNDGGEKDVEYEQIASYRTDDMDAEDIYLPVGNVSLEISAKENPAIQSVAKQIGQGDFDRLSVEDKKDLRWVVRMDELYGKSMSVKNIEDIYTTTNLSVKNGEFFTYELDDEWHFEKFELNGKKVENLEPFGTVAETIGAEIAADKVELKINLDGEVYTHEFSNNKSGLPNKIIVENVDMDGNMVSDLQHYEKCFELEGATPVRLAGNNSGEAITKENAVEESNGRDFCHPVMPGGD